MWREKGKEGGERLGHVVIRRGRKVRREREIMTCGRRREGKEGRGGGRL